MVIGDKCAYWPNCTRDAPQIALRKSLYILLGGLWVVRHQHTRHVDHSNGIASVCWVAHDVAHKIGNYNQAPRIIPYADLAVGHSVLASGTSKERVKYRQNWLAQRIRIDRINTVAICMHVPNAYAFSETSRSASTQFGVQSTNGRRCRRSAETRSRESNYSRAPTLFHFTICIYIERRAKGWVD